MKRLPIIIIIEERVSFFFCQVLTILDRTSDINLLMVQTSLKSC